MKEFIEIILEEELSDEIEEGVVESVESFFQQSSLIKYLDYKMGAIYGNSKTRRSLANIYAIYSLLYFYTDDFYNRPDEYREFEGYEYTNLFNFYRGLYGGSKLQNHALNSRVNGEFENRFKEESAPPLIIIENGKYLLHITYLYVEGIDISRICKKICEEYISILMLKDNKLITDIQQLINLDSIEEKKSKIVDFLEADAEARIFEIISYAILKNHYKNTKVYFGYTPNDLSEEELTLYKTGRTNANDGGIDFVMKPLGRFFQVTEVNNYNKYLLDADKVLHYPITFVVKTNQASEKIREDISDFIFEKANGMKILIKRYEQAIEEIITINELKIWLESLDPDAVNNLLRDIDLYYKLELNLPTDTLES